jgi:hypothetical protein
MCRKRKRRGRKGRRRTRCVRGERDCEKTVKNEKCSFIHVNSAIAMQISRESTRNNK